MEKKARLNDKKRAKRRTKSKEKPKPEDNTFFSSWTALAGLAPPEEAADDGMEIEPRDHREFPFSERDEYPKFAVQEALAPSTKAPVKGTVCLSGCCHCSHFNYYSDAYL